MYKKLLALLLAVVMAVGLLPVAAFAADSDFVIDEYGGLTGYNGPGGDVVIPSGVTYIGSGAFAGCDGLTGVTIPSGVTYIGEAAFLSCKNLACVTIPASVTTIMVSAFAECPLKDVYYGGSESQWGEIEYLQIFGPSIAFSDGGQEAANLGGATIHYNSAAGPEEPEKPGSDADFQISDGVLTWFFGSGDVTIPNSVTTIGEFAFSDCGSLTSVTIPNSVTTIGDSAFALTGLTSVTIPNSVTTIGEYAFSDCGSLTSVTIPNSVTDIGAYAFWNCGSLVSVTIPGSVTVISDRMFKDCIGLTSVTILDGVTTIGDEAFSTCTSLISVTIPNSVTAICDLAFWSCTSLTSVTIPNSVTTIGSGAFSFCESLASVTVPSSVTAIDAGAFDFCDSLTDIYYGGSVNQWKQIFNENDYWQPPTDVTIHYNSTASKTSFTDVPAGAWYADAVNWAVQDGVTTGTGDGTTFSPNTICTHQEILTFLWRAAGKPTSSSQAPVTVDTWARDSVNWAFEKGIIDPYFRASAPCTRADTVTYMWKAANSPSAPSSSFPDVPADAAYAKAVNWAVDKGVTTGTDNGTFEPNTTCDRSQIVTFLYRAYAN